MKILVIGLGSMGKRRIRLLKEINSSIDITGVDSRADRCKDAESLFAINTVSNLKLIDLEGFKAAFICTAPLAHSGLITWCLNNGLNVFTEINLVADGYEYNIRLAEEKSLVLFLSSTFLYREEIRYIKEVVNQSNSVLTYSYHVGQYLPDWHPWEKYNEYFIGDRRTNGCREIMAIEFPWITRIFGNIVDILIKKGKKTNLHTNYNDSYLLLIEHESGIQGIMAIDVVSRKAVRNLEIFGEDLYLSWDGSPNGLRQYNTLEKKEENVQLYTSVEHKKEYANFVVENAYKNEIISFMDTLEKHFTPVYGFLEDLEILKLIDRIEGEDEK